MHVASIGKLSFLQPNLCLSNSVLQRFIAQTAAEEKMSFRLDVFYRFPSLPITPLVIFLPIHSDSLLTFFLLPPRSALFPLAFLMSSPVSWSLSLCCGLAINPRERENGICVWVVCCCVAVHNASEVQASCSPPTAVAWGPPDCITHAHIHTLVEPNMRWWESIIIHPSLTFGTFTIQTVKLAISDLCLCIFLVLFLKMFFQHV